MVAKKKGPGIRGAGALKNRVRKKHSKPTKHRLQAQPKPFTPRREMWLYDGQNLLGTLITKPTGETLAFDASRKSLGWFKTFEEATAAINDCAACRRSGAPHAQL